MPALGPLSFDACMARSWPGITDKAAFCAALHRGDLKKRDAKTDLGFALEIKKLDQEKHIATGWVSVVEDADGNPIIDAEGHLLPITELEKAVHSAFSTDSGKGKGGDLHETQGVIDVLESFVVTAEKRDALGFGKGPAGWVASFRVNDENVWDKIKTGERPELSLRGTGRGTLLRKEWTDITKSDTPILIRDIELNKLEWFSTVDRGAAGDDKHRPTIVLWKRKKSLFDRLGFNKNKRAQLVKGDAMTLEEILAQLPEEQRTVIVQALQDASKPAEPAAAAAQPAPAPVPPPEQTPIAKRDDVPDDVKLELAKREDEAKRADAARIELAKRVEKLEDDRLTLELQKRVEKDMTFIPGKTDELVSLIKSVRKTDEDAAKKLEERLVVLSKAMKQSPLLSAMGTGAVDIEGDNPKIELEKRARELVKSDPSMTLAKAKMRELELDPDLYRQIQAEA